MPKLPECICLPNDYEYDDGRDCPRHGSERDDLWAKTHGRPYTCSVCHGRFIADPRFIKEAKAEYKRKHHKPFPGMENVGIVCDTCYPKVIEFGRKYGFLPMEDSDGT